MKWPRLANSRTLKFTRHGSKKSLLHFKEKHVSIIDQSVGVTILDMATYTDDNVNMKIRYRDIPPTKLNASVSLSEIRQK